MDLDEQKIAQELHVMAREARPVDAHVYAARALARSARRRLSWSLAGLAVAAASVVGVVAVLPASGGQDIAASVHELPDNTREQVKLIRDCMPLGGPVHEMDGRKRILEHGKVDDFRVLAEYRDDVGSTAFVGSTAGFVLCTPQKYPDFADRAVFTYWGYAPPGDLEAGLTGALTVDAYEVQTDSHAMRDGDQSGGGYRVVAGRVASDVRRVEIDWADGRRTAAQVHDGFFLGRVPAAFVPASGDGGGSRAEPPTTVASPDVTVTAYGEAGRILGERRDVKFLTAGRTGSESGSAPAGGGVSGDDVPPAEDDRAAPSPRLS
ncbi:hypothetical protein [Microtetraspora malaysiensis]|uniref:hypothetical protein n=1 Tax=Microtetraspora malaysiensis TaxID=161358 RepID=UPI000833278C|nr:hypothetical protein [Microtetraspora malaysiensis]